MNLLFCPDGLLVLAVLFATLAFGWTIRRRRASAKLLLAGSAALFCGVLSAMLVLTHVVIFIATRAAQTAEVTTRIAWSKKLIIAGVPYDMRLYSILLLAAVMLVPAVQCIRAATTTAIGVAEGWRSTVHASLLLIALSVPLIPLQPFALPVAIAALVSLEIAFLARRDLTTFARGRRGAAPGTKQVPRLDSVSAR
jgi:hypothetical protein